MDYSPDDILKLVGIRTEILKAIGHSETEIEKDIEGYLIALKNPTPELKKFTDQQLWIRERWPDGNKT